jgi:clan AA aspartic protease
MCRFSITPLFQNSREFHVKKFRDYEYKKKTYGERAMGLSYVRIKVANPSDFTNSVEVRCLVDSGAVYSVIPSHVLDSIDILPHSSRTFILANGEEIKRKIGTAAFEYQGQRGDSLVVFGEEGESAILGATTLEGFGFVIEPFKRELRPLPMMLAHFLW